MELRKTKFTKPELARCLAKFGYLYGRLMSASNSSPNLSTVVDLENLINDAENACGLEMPEVKKWIDEARVDLGRDPVKAQLDILRALGNLADGLRLIERL